jgi:hypothetical protein
MRDTGYHVDFTIEERIWVILRAKIELNRQQVISLSQVLLRS